MLTVDDVAGGIYKRAGGTTVLVPASVYTGYPGAVVRFRGGQTAKSNVRERGESLFGRATVWHATRG